MRSVDDLERNAVIFWPTSLSSLEKDMSIIPRLLETQDTFINILSVADKTPFAWTNALATTARLPANLFVKHLMVLADLGGEKTTRYSKHLAERIGNTLTFIWNGNEYSYDFQTLGENGKLWTNANLRVDGKGLLYDEPLSPMMEDAANLILHAGTCTNPDLPQELQEKCIIGSLIGRKREIDRYVKQRYIWVSRITRGATANTMGHLAQNYVAEFLRMELPDWDFSGKSIPGVTQNQKTDITFDMVARSPNNEFCAIEVSFQVTTNSTIERKAGQARARKELLNSLGHRIAYVIDGSGNFERTSAMSTLSRYSDCIVTFKDEELRSLACFLATGGQNKQYGTLE